MAGESFYNPNWARYGNTPSATSTVGNNKPRRGVDLNTLVAELQQDTTLSDEERKKRIRLVVDALSKGESPDESYTYEESLNILGPVLQKELNSPWGKKYQEQMARERNSSMFARRSKPFFDAMLAGYDLSTSLKQIKASDKAQKKLNKPILPNPNALDPAINNAISQAQQGSLEALRALEPAKQEIAQQRLQDEAVAKSVSRGQAGAYGSLTNAASLRAMRAASGLPVIEDQIRARQQQRADGLIALRQGQYQQNFNNAMRVAQVNTDQYNLDAAAAAALGVAGRTNLRNTLGQMPGVISNSIGSNLSLDQQYRAYADKVRRALASRQTPQAQPQMVVPTYQTPPTFSPGEAHSGPGTEYAVTPEQQALMTNTPPYPVHSKARSPQFFFDDYTQY